MNPLFDKVDVKTLNENVFHLLDNQWMLITAGRINSYNTMTASWGGFGILWDKPIAICFIRPHRHTFNFVNQAGYYTLSVLPHEFKKILNYCGKYSGRDVDKIKETGLLPIETDLKNISFEQARLIFECRKLYSDDLKPDQFISKDIIMHTYPRGDFHRFFIGEIVTCFVKKVS
jgi:flavin reductase (DIM6/NTAB) family NADH-FMN oxidoreductase RutF